MTQSTPLHYGIYYFRLSCGYCSDEERKNLLSKNKGRFLSLAESLLKNGHIKESWFYYYQLDCIAPLSGKHQDFFNFTNDSRNIESSFHIIKDFYEKYPNDLEIPYGVLLMESEELPKVEKLLDNYDLINLNQQDFGKSVLKINYDKISKNEEYLKEHIDFLKSVPSNSDSLSLFKKTAQQQNFIYSQSLLFDLLEINENLEMELEKLKEKIRQEFLEQKDILSKLSNVPLPKYEIESINQISNKVFGAIKILHSTEAEQASDNMQLPKDFISDFLDFQKDQNLIRKTSQIPSSDTKDLLPFLLNGINIENEHYLNHNAYKKFKENIKTISSIIEKGRSILQSVFAIDEHYSRALNQQFKLEIIIAHFFQNLKIIQFLHDEKLIKEYNKLEKYSATTVFISYSTQDDKEMEFLREKLELKGIKVIVDKNSLNLNDLIQAQLEKTIGNCDYFITLISPNSLGSEWVGFEVLSVIKEKAKNKFIPLIIDAEIRTIEFREYQREKIKEGWDHLRKIRDQEENVQGDTPKDIKKRLKRVGKLKKKFPTIYSEITEKISLDFSNSVSIEENFPKLLDQLIATQTK